MPENENGIFDLESAAKIITRQGEKIIELENRQKDYEKNKKIVNLLQEIIKELTPTDQSNS